LWRKQPAPRQREPEAVLLSDLHVESQHSRPLFAETPCRFPDRASRFPLPMAGCAGRHGGFTPVCRARRFQRVLDVLGILPASEPLVQSPQANADSFVLPLAMLVSQSLTLLRQRWTKAWRPKQRPRQVRGYVRP
jgi:hypothetical protein